MIIINKNRPIRFKIKRLIIIILPEPRNDYNHTSGGQPGVEAQGLSLRCNEVLVNTVRSRYKRQLIQLNMNKSGLHGLEWKTRDPNSLVNDSLVTRTHCNGATRPNADHERGHDSLLDGTGCLRRLPEYDWMLQVASRSYQNRSCELCGKPIRTREGIREAILHCQDPAIRPRLVQPLPARGKTAISRVYRASVPVGQRAQHRRQKHVCFCLF